MPDNNFSTPSQLETQRAIAKALLEESGKTPSGTSGHFTAVSPLAPFAQMAEALAGGYISRKAGEQEIELQRGMRVPPAGGTPGAAGDVSDASPDAAAPDEDTAAPTAYAPPKEASGGDFLEKIMKPMIAQRESADSKEPYRALGPTVRSGDRAYGKYQVMGSNIPEWTQAALGKAMTPQEFLANDKAQEAVASHRLGQYLAQTGNPRDAASMWFSGRPLAQAQNLRAHDPSGRPIGISGAQYASAFPTSVPGAAPGGLSSPQGGSAMAFSGEPAQAPIQMPGSPAAMSTALAPETAGGTPAAAGGAEAPVRMAGGPAPARPALGVPGTAAAPGVTPPRPRVTDDQALRAMVILGTPGRQSDPIALATYQAYQMQNQPQVGTDEYGRQVIFGRNGKSMTINPIDKTMESAGKGTSFPVYRRQGEGPGGQPVMGQVPGGNPAPAAAPVAPEAPEEDVPSLKFAPEGKEAGAGKGAEALPAEITKGPEAAKAEKATMLGTKPPEAEVGALPFDKVAGTKLPPAPSATDLSDMTPAQRYNWIQNQENAQAATQHQNQVNIDDSTKANKLTQDVARISLGAKTDIDVGARLIQDPRLQALMGPGHDLKRDWSDVKAFLGNQDANLASGLDQTFQKIISSGIIKTLKSDYGGLGQIRNKEIELSDKATLSQRNTLESNLAILEIAKKTFERNVAIGKIANAYMEGKRWDKDGKPIPGKTGGIPSYAELSGVVNEFLDHHPIFDDKVKDKNGKTEMDHYISIFDKKEEESAPVKSGGARTVDKLPEGEWTKKPKAPPVEVPMR